MFIQNYNILDNIIQLLKLCDTLMYASIEMHTQKFLC